MKKKKRRTKKSSGNIVQSETNTVAPSPETALEEWDKDNELPANENFIEQSPHVLIADDAEPVRKALAAILEECGFTYETACDGKAAVDRAVEYPFDVILMDIQMPRLDGLRAARRIRSISIWNANTPILAVTGHTRQEDRARCFDAGMDGLVPKPVRPGDLLAALRKVLPQWRDVSDTKAVAGNRAS